MKDTVSVVVPVFNMERYLKRCVDSILGQTHSNLEVILVNDGSVDRSSKICDNYASKDSRVSVIHKKNGGLSDARNVGIKAATSKWVALVDSDDWVSDNFIELLLNTAISTDSDISICSYKRVYENDGEEGTTSSPKFKVMNNIQAIKDLFGHQRFGGPMAWNKLYKRSLFVDNNIIFPEGRIHEDNFTTYKLFFYADKITFNGQTLYNYLQRPDSIMGKSFDERRLDIFDAIDETRAFVKSKGLSLDLQLNNYELVSAIGVLDSALTAGSGQGQHVDYIKNKITNIRFKSIINPLVSIRHKIMIILIMISPRVYMRIKRFTKNYNST